MVLFVDCRCAHCPLPIHFRNTKKKRHAFFLFWMQDACQLTIGEALLAGKVLKGTAYGLIRRVHMWIMSGAVTNHSRCCC